MKILIIGGVAAGTKAGAKLKREIPDADVTIYTKSKDISYAGCGLPYYVGGAIYTKSQLVVNTPESFSSLTGVKVNIMSEVTSVDTKGKTITVNGEKVGYDKLIIACGAEPFVPPIEGRNLDGVFTVRTPDDAENIRKYTRNCKKALVVGGGFIGIEMAENLMSEGLDVTIIDMAPQLASNIFDMEMADFMRRKLESEGIHVRLSTGISSINGENHVENISTTNGDIQADMVILSMGIRPSTAFLRDSGIEMDRGLVLTDEYGRTNIEDIYSAGDCAMVTNRLTKKRQWSAMGSTANIVARCIGLNISGENARYEGCLGTGVVKLTGHINAGRTGLTEVQAREAGYKVETAIAVTDDKAHYYPDSGVFATKIIADENSHKLLGMQVVGNGAVDKMTDIAVVGISAGLKIDDFISMDFAYAPPFSTAIHPFAVACGVLYNKLTKRLVSVTPLDYLSGKAKDYTIIDASPVPAIKNAEWIDGNDLDGFSKKHKKDEKLLLVCVRGKRAYFLRRKLCLLGYKNVKTLEGGGTFNDIKL